MTKRLGILGGMGPAASAEFVTRLIQQTPASTDQEHIPFVLWNEPRTPDRSTSMRDGNDYPLPYLKEGILSLKSVGCDYIVIPCNSAHYWYDEMNTLGVPILHIVDSVVDELKSLDILNQTIGVLGTQGTIEYGIYQHHLENQGWKCIVPNSSEMDYFVQPAIDFIKAGKLVEATLLLVKVIDSLIERGAKAVVLGCTELPLAVRELEQNGIPLVNSIDSLVKKAIFATKGVISVTSA
jgi:aspartate racemase